MKRIIRSNEFYVALTIIVVGLLITSRNQAFLSIENMIDLMRSSIVMGIFALGTMIVIISGGIDVSFPAVATFSMFATTKLLYINDYQGSILLAFIISGAIGLLLGLINGVLIGKFNLPTLIVTLGTSSMYTGFLLTYVGDREISDIPKGMIDFSKVTIFEYENARGVISALPASMYIFVAMIFIVGFLLKYTMLGRGIYAIGGDRLAAQRAGFNVIRIQVFIYAFVGFTAGIAGMVQTSMMRNCNPVSMLGSEMIIIAAVVLGGVRISGGHGTVIGTLLGLLLILILDTSLILVGVPSYWQRFVIGTMIIVGTGVTAYQNKRGKEKMNEVALD